MSGCGGPLLTIIIAAVLGVGGSGFAAGEVGGGVDADVVVVGHFHILTRHHVRLSP